MLLSSNRFENERDTRARMWVSITSIFLDSVREVCILYIYIERERERANGERGRRRAALSARRVYPIWLVTPDDNAWWMRSSHTVHAKGVCENRNDLVRNVKIPLLSKKYICNIRAHVVHTTSTCARARWEGRENQVKKGALKAPGKGSFNKFFLVPSDLSRDCTRLCTRIYIYINIYIYTRVTHFSSDFAYFSKNAHPT